MSLIYDKIEELAVWCFFLQERMEEKEEQGRERGEVNCQVITEKSLMNINDKFILFVILYVTITCYFFYSIIFNYNFFGI
jgi:hypothetical protein